MHWSPVLKRATLTTAASVGRVSRATSGCGNELQGLRIGLATVPHLNGRLHSVGPWVAAVMGSENDCILTCSATTMKAAATIGSVVRCGMAAWPPRPLTVISNLSAAAIIVPACTQATTTSSLKDTRNVADWRTTADDPASKSLGVTAAFLQVEEARPASLCKGPRHPASHFLTERDGAKCVVAACAAAAPLRHLRRPCPAEHLEVGLLLDSFWMTSCLTPRPTFRVTVPDGVVGHTCSPDTADTPFNAPAAIMSAASPGPSSAGWLPRLSSRTLPLKAPSRAFSSFAAAA